MAAHFGGFRDVMRHVLLVDMAIHTFDAARLLSREDVRVLTDSVRQVSPAAVDELIPGLLSLAEVQRVLQGMLTERQMDRLAAARGTAFDRLFLESMIRHHEGAVTMARDLLGSGSEALAIELAADVALGQEAEIGRMVEIEQQL